jgi:hypothetical protein
VAVYVDRLCDWGWRLGPSCHLVADSEAELHAFAARLGLRRGWAQVRRGRVHYDLTRARRARAVRLGALPVDCRQLILIQRGEHP